MNKYWEKITDVCFRNGTTFLLLISALFFAISFVQVKEDTAAEETKQVQKRIVSRLNTLENYAEKALNAPVSEWLVLDNVPEDMVLYKYNADTLQSWVNLFPISNDEVDLIPFWYRINDLTNRNLFNTPLAYIGEGYQYVNLGSSWYVVKIYKKENVKVVAGLEIKTDYTSENSLLSNKVNDKLRLDKHYTTVPLNTDIANVVFTKEGEPLFSIVSDVPLTYQEPNSIFKWVALLFVILASFFQLYVKRSTKSFLVVIFALFISRILMSILAKPLELDSPFFSPTLYADAGLFNSLGDLLLNHLILFLAILAIFLMRKKIFRFYALANKKIKKIASLGLILIPTFLVIYIHFTLRSLILNSSIVLELYRLEEISIYTILVYFSYALLFIALLFSLQLINIISNKKYRLSMFAPKKVIAYILIISLYCVSIISIYGFKREFERNRVLTNKLSVQRDISLELQLRTIESHIASDPLIRLLASVPHGTEMIESRLNELYLWNVLQKYNLRVTVCKENDKLITENYSNPVDCFDFFNREIIGKYGIPLANRSAFYFVNNYKSRISYIGAFSFLKPDGWYTLFIEIDSKIASEAIGYPSLLLDTKNKDDSRVPANYSYAKYFDGKLTSYKGRYNYSVELDENIKNNYYFTTKNGYVHFINNIFDDNVIVVSRKARTFLPYLVFYSYIVLFFGGTLLLLTRFRREKKKGDNFISPSQSFRRKITYLLVAAMVFSLIAMGIGSVILIVNVINENNRIQMEEKLHTVQTTLSEMCKYAQEYNEINTMEMFNAMDKVANNTQVDINLYNPFGTLIRSTKPEVFDQYLVSTRIDPVAYYNIIIETKRQFINKEKIANLSYYSLYAPIFNINGKMVAIANIPYFLNNSEFQSDASSIIAAVINLYLLLLLATVLLGTTFSNSLTRPLTALSKRMREIDVSKKAEHINYKGKDELGVLVRAYNKMVDDLEESTQQLAQSEREQAWREMARQIAHEIKNPLTPMKLSIQHLIRIKQQNIPGWEDKLDELASSLIEQIDILSDTATEFSSFAKFYNEESSVIDLQGLLKEQFILFNNRENITFVFNSSFEVAYIFAKKSQITRALVNLISNSIQAIEHKRDGYIRMTLSEDGNFYKVEIEDNGTGVSPDNTPKLFKPNFTTKSGGTGLGLAICKNIVDQSQGTIGYKTSELGGANFYIHLPKYMHSYNG